MYAWLRRLARDRCSGFTLIEFVGVLAILGILLALAMPAYVFAKKTAYRGEAHNVLQEIKALEWAYYQQYNLFDVSGASIGLGTPGSMHWAAPSFGGDPAQSVQILMSGCGAACGPMGTSDQVSLVLTNDGSSTTGSSF
jgi:prepilin-type N-terminal cleavage/methylation domain-containing protein